MLFIGQLSEEALETGNKVDREISHINTNEELFRKPLFASDSLISCDRGV
jgi:hypothetical protein